MNEKQRNWLRMYKNVALVLDDNQEIVETVAPAKEGRLLLKENTEDIDDLNAVQLKSSGGITADKLVVKNDYTGSILKVCDGTKGFAASTGNNTLLGMPELVSKIKLFLFMKGNGYPTDDVRSRIQNFDGIVRKIE